MDFYSIQNNDYMDNPINANSVEYVEQEEYPLANFSEAYNQPNGEEEEDYSEYDEELRGKNLVYSGYVPKSRLMQQSGMETTNKNNMVCFDLDKVSQIKKENKMFVEEQGKQMMSLVDIIGAYEKENTDLKSKLNTCNMECNPSMNNNNSNDIYKKYNMYMYNYNLYYVLLVVLLVILLFIIIM